MPCSRNVMRATSGSTSSRMSASVMMLPVRFDRRTVSPSRTSFTSWPSRTSGSAAGFDTERLHARLERLHLPVVVGAPDVDEVRPPAVELVAVVREVVEQIRGGAVGLRRARGRAGRRSRSARSQVAPSVSYVTPRSSGARAPRRPRPRSCSVRSENQVSKCTPMRPRSSLQLRDDVVVAPLAGRFLG